MTQDALYTLEELAQAAQVTPRTIRYYAAKGLLPAPQSRGRFALYGAAHLNRLRLIALLKQALLPIAAMRDSMLHLTDAQIMALLTSRHEARSAEQDSAPAPDSEAAESYHYLLDVLTARSREGGERKGVHSVDLGKGESRGEEEKRRRGEKETEAEKIHNPQSTIHNRQSTIVHSETWQRILLTDDVELHVRLRNSSQDREQLERRIAAVRELFSA